MPKFDTTYSEVFARQEDGFSARACYLVSFNRVHVSPFPSTFFYQFLNLILARHSICPAKSCTGNIIIVRQLNIARLCIFCKNRIAVINSFGETIILPCELVFRSYLAPCIRITNIFRLGGTNVVRCPVDAKPEVDQSAGFKFCNNEWIPCGLKNALLAIIGRSIKSNKRSIVILSTTFKVVYSEG
jgi:hypothetical protein